MRSMDYFTFFWAEFVGGWSIWNKEKMWSFPKNKLQSPELKCVLPLQLHHIKEAGQGYRWPHDAFWRFIILSFDHVRDILFFHLVSISSFIYSFVH